MIIEKKYIEITNNIFLNFPKRKILSKQIICKKNIFSNNLKGINKIDKVVKKIKKNKRKLFIIFK